VHSLTLIKGPGANPEAYLFDHESGQIPAFGVYGGAFSSNRVQPS
jgi:hypothetical protein